MELDGEVYPVSFVVASKFAPKDPTINNINFFTQQEFITRSKLDIRESSPVNSRHSLINLTFTCLAVGL